MQITNELLTTLSCDGAKCEAGKTQVWPCSGRIVRLWQLSTSSEVCGSFLQKRTFEANFSKAYDLTALIAEALSRRLLPERAVAAAALRAQKLSAQIENHVLSYWSGLRPLKETQPRITKVVVT